MAKDTRTVKRGIGVTENDKYRVVTDPDQIAGMFPQSKLDEFIREGVISADSLDEWKSTFTGGTGEPHPLSLDEAMERFSSGDSAPEVFESLKFHQPEIARRRAEQKGAEENQSSDDENEQKSKARKK